MLPCCWKAPVHCGDCISATWTHVHPRVSEEWVVNKGLFVKGVFISIEDIIKNRKWNMFFSLSSKRTLQLEAHHQSYVRKGKWNNKTWRWDDTKLLSGYLNCTLKKVQRILQSQKVQRILQSRSTYFVTYPLPFVIYTQFIKNILKQSNKNGKMK